MMFFFFLMGYDLVVFPLVEGPAILRVTKINQGTRTGAPLLSVPMVFCLVVSNIFSFHPYLGKISNLTNIFHLG